jgi:hypothetical protein
MQPELIPMKVPVDPKNPTYYLDKYTFNRALKDYKTACLAEEAIGLPAPKVPEYIGECLLNIARGVGQKHNFRSYSFINDMISDAVYTCLRYVRSYDPDRLNDKGESTSALSYFTQACHYSFIARIATEKKQTRVKRALVMSADLDTFTQSGDDSADEFRMNLSEFISSLGTDDAELDAKIVKQNKAKTAMDDKPGAFDAFME